MMRLRSWIVGVLWVLLAAQSIQILVLGFGPKYQAPKPLIDWIEQYLASKDLRCEFTSLWIDAHGGVSCENLSIFKLNSIKPIAGAEKLYLLPHWWQIVLGQWKPKHLQVSNGFLAPLLHQKPLLRQIHFKGRGFAWGWNIDACSLRIGDHRIQAKGQLAALFHKNHSVFEASSFSLNDFVDSLQGHLSFCQNGEVVLRCHRSSIGQTLINARCIVDSFANHAIALENVFAEGSFLIGPSGMQPQTSFYLQGESASYEKTLHAPFLQAAAWIEPPPNAPFSPVLKNVEFFAPALKNIPFPIERSWIKVKPDCYQNPYCDVLVGHKDSWAVFSGDCANCLKLKDKQLPPIEDLLDLSASISSQTFQAIRPFIALLEDVPLLTAFKIHGWRRLSQEASSYKVHFQSGPVQWKTIILESARGVFSYAPGSWGLDAFEAKHQTGIISGAVEVQPNNRYAIRLKGGMEPTLLDPYLPSWWQSIWPPLKFSSQLPRTDLRIVYEDASPVYFNVYGSISGEKLNYYGMPCDSFHTKIKAGLHQVDLGPFQATVGSKEATGKISWLFNPSLGKTSFALKSNLPIKFYGIFASVGPIVKIFAPEDAPRISAVGELPKGALYPSQLNLDLDSPKNISIKGIILDHLHLHCEQDSKTITLSPLQIGLGKGKINAEAKVALAKEASQDHSFELELNVNDVQIEELKKSFPLLNKLEIQPTTTRTALQNNAGPFGLIDGFFKGDGILGDPLKLNGAGFLHLQASHQPNTFLGVQFYTNNFKKPLEASAANMKDLFIQELYAPIMIDKNLLSVKEGWIRGPTSRIIMNGNCNLENEAIDFTFSMQPFREVPLLSAAFFPLRPITQALRMRFIGILSNPEVVK